MPLLGHVQLHFLLPLTVQYLHSTFNQGIVGVSILPFRVKKLNEHSTATPLYHTVGFATPLMSVKFLSLFYP